jgi:hypothetical protein
MVRRLACAWALLLITSGCVSTESDLAMVTSGPTGSTSFSIPRKLLDPNRAPPATQAEARRVDELGKKIVAANKHLNPSLAFLTIGGADEELFHQDAKAIIITEKLSRKCSTDEELAAVLCMELGRMMAERERLTNPQMRQPGGGPSMDVPVGNDYRNMYGGPDQTRLVELTKYDREHRRSCNDLPPPTADVLARAYLAKAGYDPKELDAVAPLLRDAEAHVALERQMTGQAPPKVMPGS